MGSLLAETGPQSVALVSACGLSATERTPQAPSPGQLGAGGPPSADIWLHLKPDTVVPAGPAADDECAADQVLSGSLEFMELLIVLFGYFPQEVAHHVAIDQYRNGCGLFWVGYRDGGQMPVVGVPPGPGSGCCLTQ